MKRRIIVFVINLILATSVITGVVVSFNDKCNHNYFSKTTPPTCTTDGYATYICEKCEDLYIDDYIPANHTFIDCLEICPDCETYGTKAGRYCSGCGFTEGLEEIDPIGHNYIPTWKWNEYDTATLILICSHNSNHKIKIPAEIKENEILKENCEENESIEYKAIASYNGIEYSDIKTKQLEKLGHTYSCSVIPPKCDEKGYTLYECDNCDYEYKDNYTEKLGHSYETLWEWVDYETVKLTLTCVNNSNHKVEITEIDIIDSLKRNTSCGESGIIIHTAMLTYNDVLYTDSVEETVDMLAHDYVASWEWNGYESAELILTCTRDSSHTISLDAEISSLVNLEANCSDYGEKKYTATALYDGLIYTNEKYERLEKTNHIYVDEVVNPTCIEDGYTIHKCSKCQYSYTDFIVSSTGHSYSETIMEPTCNTCGYTLYKCVNCNDEYTSDYTDKLQHDYISKQIQEADCLNEGIIKYTCILCEDTYNETTSALGHEVVIDSAVSATCIETGLTEGSHCSRCDTILVAQVETSVLGHEVVIDSAVSATCIETGLTEGSHCSRCDTILIAQEIIQEKNHNYEYSVITEAKCLTDGVATYLCSYCEDTYTEAISALGHEVVIDSAVSATCIETGLTEGSHCSRCSEVLVFQKEIAKLNHNYVYGICDRCDDINVEYFSSTYGYDMLATRDNAEDLQQLYNAFDEIYMNYHQNYVDIVDVSGYYDLTRIKYLEYGVTLDEAKYVWKMYRYDHPVFYWNRYGALSGTVSGTQNYSFIAPRMFSEFINGSVREKYDKLFIEFIQKYVPDCPFEESIYTQVLYFFDLIIGLVDYKYTSSGAADTSGYAHSIAGILDESGVVCEGYAYMLSLLLTAVGIENIYVTGEDHAYNLVKLDDGNWYWFDATWADQPDWQLGVDYNYFAVNDTQAIGELGYLWECTTTTFMPGHEPDSSETMNLSASYELPQRSSVIFDDESILEIYESFTIDTMTYTLIGYNKVMLSNSTGTGDIVIGNTVTYNGNVYTVVAIGAMYNDLPYPMLVFKYNTTSITIPSTVEFIIDKAFTCNTLSAIYVDEDNPYFTDVDGVLFTKNMFTLIKYPSNKTGSVYTVPNEVIDIALYAFRNLQKLKTLYIGENVQYIGTYNFGYGYRNSSSDKVRYDSSEYNELTGFLEVIYYTEDEEENYYYKKEEYLELYV